MDIAFASDNHLFLVAIASDCFCDAPGILLTLANVEAKMGKASMDTRELTPGKASECQSSSAFKRLLASCSV